ncbi:MAG: hypothetical protein AB1435_00895 [Chloroflexota bacterium]
MTLTELLQAINTLSAEELRELREHIEQRQRVAAAETLVRALDDLRQGLRDADLARLEWAMNVEVVQRAERSAWQT